MIVGGVDTYYDYDEHQWKFRRLGGGPVRRAPVCPAPGATDDNPGDPSARRTSQASNIKLRDVALSIINHALDTKPTTD